MMGMEARLESQAHPREREPVSEPPTMSRSSPTDGAERPGRTFSRLVAAPTIRRLAPRRLAVSLLVVVLVAGGLGLGGYRAVRTVAAWFRNRPEWSARFDAITLDPPPPSWIRVGGPALLERIRQASGRPETLPVQGIDLSELAQDFSRHSPWIRAVQGIDRVYPNRLIVRLEYRRPVAFVRTRSGMIVIDRDGVVLPYEELSDPTCGTLIEVALASGDTSQAKGTAGLLLRFSQGPEESAADSRPAVYAAGLAAFLLAQRETPPATRVPTVRAVQLKGRSVWVELDGPCQVLWSAHWDQPGEPSDAVRWKTLREWFDRNPASSLKYPEYLVLERDRAVRKRPGSR